MTPAPATTVFASLQPLLDREVVIIRAPTQAWSATDGQLGGAPIHGIYHSDVRIVSRSTLTIGGQEGEHIATAPGSATASGRADTMAFVALLRHLDDAVADPRVRVVRRRTVDASGASESVVIESGLAAVVTTTIVVRIESDLASMAHVKAGLAGEQITLAVTDAGATWSNETVTASLQAPGARVAAVDDGLDLSWDVVVPAKGRIEVGWTLRANDTRAVVVGSPGKAPWSAPVVASGDSRLGRWVQRALGDLDGLRMTTGVDGASHFLAAGAPWFFTLFGRDSLWAARFMLPLGTELAAGTLRVLAALQGRESVDATAEQPGKIMHELRRGPLEIPGENVSLPPLYYGTVDATPLWVCLLHDAWRWGMPDDEVRALVPSMIAALEWMRDYGDADGDGLLEYVDATGHGLSNQGWKDSGDSVQWRDGTLATGPIALCEVQAYAYEAAMHGADLLDHLGQPGGVEWRNWAAVLKTRFSDTFWIESADGAYPAIALDADKRAVDTVTSNIGHLLGTGLLTPTQAALVARRLSSPELDSGYGLRTMSTDSAGYWPLSYHGGSVWTHDTAIAIAGLAAEGFRDAASSLARGLLSAAEAFDYRMPELHSGDAAGATSVPVPYPAACRPQAWSAAAAISVLGSVLGLRPGDDALTVSPMTTVGALSVTGLRFGGSDVAITVNADGEVTSASGAAVEVA